HSEMSRPPEPVTALHVCSPRFGNRGTPGPSMLDEEIGMPAKRGIEHATIATLIAASPRCCEHARDRATSWRGALDDPGQSETGGGGRVGMAAGRRRDRRGSGNSAVWAGPGPAGPAAAGRAGLGGPGARAKASWRHDDD